MVDPRRREVVLNVPPREEERRETSSNRVLESGDQPVLTDSGSVDR